MRIRGRVAASVITVVIAALVAGFACGCSSQNIPDGTSQEMYEIGCDALSAIDEALDSNDMFSAELQDELKTLSVKARDASRNSEDGQDNNQEILSGIQGTLICLSQNDGDGAMDYIDQLRSALGK